jgi:hypothetical protein
MGCNVHDMEIKVVVYDIRDRNLKLLTYFGMIQNYDKISRWNAKSGKIYTLKNSYLFNSDQHKACGLLGQLYVFLITSCKRFHSKILSYEKVKKDQKGFTILL